jgi:hypothetical protein
MSDQGMFWAKEIPGVGESSADKISDAFAQFWAKHPEFCCETT